MFSWLHSVNVETESVMGPVQSHICHIRFPWFSTSAGCKGQVRVPNVKASLGTLYIHGKNDLPARCSESVLIVTQCVQQLASNNPLYFYSHDDFFLYQGNFLPSFPWYIRINKLSSSAQTFVRSVRTNIYHLHLSWWFISLSFTLKSKPGIEQ